MSAPRPVKPLCITTVADRRRASRSLQASVAVHALLFVLIALWPRVTPPPDVLAEVTWLDDPGGAPAPPGPPGSADPEAPTANPLPPAPAPLRRSPPRPVTAGDVAALPQADADFDTRLSERLASLRTGAASDRVQPIAVATPGSLWRASAGGGGIGTAQALGTGSGGGGMTRGGTGAGGAGGSGLSLSRGPGRGAGHGMQLAGMAAPPASALGSAPAREEASTASRTLAGALLMGQVADRPVLEYAKPAYPEWAKREAVEASVTLYFVVLPDGRVKENVRVERTAGYEDFDSNAQAALRAWRFAPLKGAGVGEQWGTITFRFQLRDS